MEPDVNEHILSIDGHGVRYHFQPIADRFGPKAAKKLMAAWSSAFAFSNPKTTYTQFQHFRRFLRAAHELAGGKRCKSCIRLIKKLASSELHAIDGSIWREAIEQVARQQPMDGTDARSSKVRRQLGEHIHTVNSVLAAFERVDAGVGYRPVSGPRRGAGPKERVPTLGELRSDGDPSVMEDVKTLDQMIDGAFQRSRERLEELRRCLLEEFYQEAAVFDQGQRWLTASAAPSLDEIDEFLFENSSKLRDKPALEEAIASHFGPVFGSALCLSVLLVARRYNGVFKTASVRDRERRLTDAAGGSLAVIRHLEACPIATNAASAIVMTEAPLNLSAISDLPKDPYVGKVQHGRRRLATIAARKARQNGSKVFGLLAGQEAFVNAKSTGGSTIEVIDKYIEMSEPLRRRAAERGDVVAASRLFLFTRAGSNAERIQWDVARFTYEVWPGFRQRHISNAIIGGLPITRRMLRTTILQLQGSAWGNDTVVPRATAGHKTDGMTARYLDASWLRAKFDAHIAMFQSLFESALLDGVEVPADFSVPSGELARRLNMARSSGFSFWCGRRSLEVSTANAAAQRPTCTPLSPCEMCPVRQFRPSQEAFASLYLMGKALDEGEAFLGHTNPARWSKYWMPWHAVVLVYKQRLLAGPYKMRYLAACRDVDQRLASGELAAPMVF